MIGNQWLQIAMERLGWGDPNKGLWFIGPEEGRSFTEPFLRQVAGARFRAVTDEGKKSWPVANTIAKLVEALTDTSDIRAYRDKTMWHEGSRIFNGNLYPLGKPSLKQWPSHYEELFDVTHKAYKESAAKIVGDRAAQFRTLRRQMEPQAIVCFGKGQWDTYKRTFLDINEPAVRPSNTAVRLFERNRVILTGHFSYGRWMSRADRAAVVEALRSWDVSVPANITERSR